MCWFFQLSSELQGPSSSTSSTRSSSIGNNSDQRGSESSDGKDCEEENEVQSAYKGKLDALEEALPIRRGLSDFYNGRSKSFMCLARASSFSSIKCVAKPEDAYTKERRNKLAHKIWKNNTSNFAPLSDRCGISKRLISPKPVRVALSRSSSISSTNSNSNSNSKLHLHLQLRSSASHNNLAVLSSLPKSLSLPDLHRHSMPDIND